MQFVYPLNMKEVRARFKVYVHEIETEFGVLIFVEGGSQKKNLVATMRTNIKLNRNMTPGQGI